jgi:glycosyltransferase involved in cell wall biosynthesis
MNTIPPNISIIIPVYNTEQYLCECLDSVVNQTMREIQIICINDGSTDGSLAILEKYANGDSRILIINKTNTGVSSARNDGLTCAIGKYILLVDSDDTIDTKLCEKVYTIAEQSNADFVLFFHNCSIPDCYKRSGDIIIDFTDKVESEEKKTLSFYSATWGKLWRSNFLKEHNLQFCEQVDMFDDSMLYWQSLQFVSKVAVVPESLYHYRKRPNSLTTWNGEHMQSIFDDLAIFQSFLVNNGFYHIYKPTFLRIKLDALFLCYQNNRSAFDSEFRKKIKILLGEDEKDYLRQERYIDYSVTYFYFCITRDWGIFFMYLRRRIRSFLGTSKRNLTKFFRTHVSKNTNKTN